MVVLTNRQVSFEVLLASETLSAVRTEDHRLLYSDGSRVEGNSMNLLRPPEYTPYCSGDLERSGWHTAWKMDWGVVSRAASGQTATLTPLLFGDDAEDGQMGELEGNTTEQGQMQGSNAGKGKQEG